MHSGDATVSSESRYREISRDYARFYDKYFDVKRAAKLGWTRPTCGTTLVHRYCDLGATLVAGRLPAPRPRSGDFARLHEIARDHNFGNSGSAALTTRNTLPVDVGAIRAAREAGVVPVHYSPAAL